jgi:hypothetical protein
MIAWLALGISAGTFIWKFIETYIRWPRVGVVMRQYVITYLGPTSLSDKEAQELGRQLPPAPVKKRTEDRLYLIVVNKGAEAMTIGNVGVRSEDGSGRIDVQERRDKGRQIAGPEFPMRVEGHGALQWIIEPELTAEFPRGTMMLGYAYRFRSFRKYPTRWRNPLKLYETPIAYFKN